MSANIEIVVPTGDVSPQIFPLSPRLTTLEGVTLGILDNAKPNADVLLRAVAGELRRLYGVGRIVSFSKNISGVPAAPGVLGALENECAVVLTGSGD